MIRLSSSRADLVPPGGREGEERQTPVPTPSLEHLKNKQHNMTAAAAAPRN